MTTTGKLTDAEIARRHLVASIAGVARWLIEDSGYTRAMAVRDLTAAARKANEGAWSDAELAQLLGRAPMTDVSTKAERRWYVTLGKRGKKVNLTLNGGVLFKDPDLAINGAKAAMKRDGWTRAVITEMELDETRPSADGRGDDRFWKVTGTATLTPPTETPHGLRPRDDHAWMLSDQEG